MEYETYETDRVYDSMERNSGADEVCGVWIKIIIVEFVIYFMQRLYSIKVNVISEFFLPHKFVNQVIAI